MHSILKLCQVQNFSNKDKIEKVTEVSKVIKFCFMKHMYKNKSISLQQNFNSFLEKSA